MFADTARVTNVRIIIIRIVAEVAHHNIIGYKFTFEYNMSRGS